jgi:hypothetical protein
LGVAGITGYARAITGAAADQADSLACEHLSLAIGIYGAPRQLISGNTHVLAGSWR